MNSFRKSCTYILLFMFIVSNYGSFVFAEGEAIHSLDELPSIGEIEDTQINTIETRFPDEEISLGDLIKKRKEYEIETTQSDIKNLEWTALVEERETYLANMEEMASESIVPTNTPLAMSPNFLINSFNTSSIQQNKSVLSEFITGYEWSLNTEHIIEKNGKKYTKKERKVAGTQWDIIVQIQSGTIIKTSEWDIIPESSIDITSIEGTKKIKAKKKYEKSMKNRGNMRKWQAEADPEGFDFGIAGKHLIFSQPVAITVLTPHMSEWMTVDLLTAHAGDIDFHTWGLSVSKNTQCNADGTTTIPGSQAIVNEWKITFYTCGASSFTMNPSGGTAGSNDLRLIIWDCGQVQLYYNNLTQIYTGNPPATGCSTASNMDAWPVLRIWTVSYGNDFTAWTSSSTVWSTVWNTYTATSTMTITTWGRTYQLIIDWSHTAPNKYITWSWRVVVPAGNTLPIKFYYGMDSYVAGADTNDVWYLSSTGGETIGIYDNVANVLSAFRYLSGTMWTAKEADPYGTVRGNIAAWNNFNNVIQSTGWDLWFWVNWDFGTPTTATTYSGTVEWRLAPYVASSVPDLIPWIGQPEGPLTTGFSSQMPIIISNAWNLSSSGVHTVVLTIPTNITGPSSAFTDNGWSCGAQAGTTVTCTKTTSITPLGSETLYIPVVPQPAAWGTNVTFNVSLSNPSDSNSTNNTAFATNAVVSAAPVIAPGGVTGAWFWVKADGWKNCTTTGCTITTWANSGTLGTAANGVTGLWTVTYDPTTLINYNPTLYFNNASLNTNNTLGLPTRANSIFVVSRIGSGWNFYIGTQTATNNTRSWKTSPTTDQWMRYNSTIFFNGTNNRAANIPAITSTIRQAWWASAGYTNWRSLLTSADTTTFTVNNIWIGRVANTNSTLSNIAEIAIYNSAITVANQNKVESYLALKYGITLDQTTATNYTLSNNGVAWNAGSGGIYNKDIAGIARDDLGWLNQLKSQSINNAWDIIVNIVWSSIGSNSRSLIWGNEWSGTGTFSTTDAPIWYQRIAREWQFQERLWDVWSVKISYPVSSLPSGAWSPIYMLVDNDSIFSAGATAYTGTLNGSNWEWTLNISDANIITFAQASDMVAPIISSTNIASGSLIPHGNFALTFNYTDTGAGISTWSATGVIYSWNSWTLSYNSTPLTWFSSITSSTSTSSTIDVTNLPFWRYRFDLSVADIAWNITTQSYTYFVDAIEWTISADTYNIGNISQNIATFGSGELTITVRTVWAGFSITTSPISILTRSSGETINYWNGITGIGYDIWNSGAFGGTILTYSPNATLANIAKNINQNGEKNTFTYRVKYGAQVDFMQAAWDYNGTVNFNLNLNY